ncbi:hypothetical protein GOV10_01115 [Candidatus Woesearchaeota archaeon]|nr:hypothetical protein [Candidatus Woesearchaeota archaeon]
MPKKIDVKSGTESSTKKRVSQKDTTETGLSIIKHGAWKFILAVLIVVSLVLLITIVIARVQILGDFFADFTDYKQEPKFVSYNGFEFEERGSGNKTIWVTRIDVNGQLYDIPFYYLPTEVEDILFEPGLADAISQAALRPEIVYITLDPDEGSRPVIGAVEISRLLGNRYGLLNLNVHATLTRPPANRTGTFNDTMTYMTCENATAGILIIQYEEADSNRVWHEGNCIRVTYKTPEDSIRVSDRFAYELLSIM